MPGESAISDEAVENATGQRWEQWFALLDAWGAKEAGHKATAAHLEAEHGLTGWWAQTVTVRYEQARGLRVVGQKSDGTFQAQVQRTIGASAQTLFAAITEPKRRAAWLAGDPALEERTLDAPTLARYTWAGPGRANGTHVEFTIEAKDDDRCAVRVQHTKLDAKEGRDMLTAYWTTALETLRDQVEDA